MKSLSESDNPYQTPSVEYVSEGNIPAIGFPFSLLCGWTSVLLVTGYCLVGLLANGYEMARAFSNRRLYDEVVLGLLFIFGVFLCQLMRAAHRRQSMRGIMWVGILALPAVAYVVSDFFYLNIGQLFAKLISVSGM